MTMDSVPPDVVHPAPVGLLYILSTIATISASILRTAGKTSGCRGFETQYLSNAATMTFCKSAPPSGCKTARSSVVLDIKNCALTIHGARDLAVVPVGVLASLLVHLRHLGKDPIGIVSQCRKRQVPCHARTLGNHLLFNVEPGFAQLGLNLLPRRRIAQCEQDRFLHPRAQPHSDRQNSRAG